MPELPEVQSVVTGLEPVLKGKSIAEIIVSWPRSVEGETSSVVETLKGRAIREVKRRGKYILLEFLGSPAYTVTIHLRMTGKLLFHLDEKNAPYVRVVFQFQDGSHLYFVDIRKFGRLKLWGPEETLLPCLGPEPLDEGSVLGVLERLKTARAIKTVLLDQRVLAGIGNIYADEALFLSGIHPLTPANRVPGANRILLARTIPQLLHEAIGNRGTTLSDYATPDNREGEHQTHLNVYGRAGEACKNCGSNIERLYVNGRSSHICPVCQPFLVLE
jgi:formamidopyrimidine-DNA glycosylase